MNSSTHIAAFPDVIKGIRTKLCLSCILLSVCLERVFVLFFLSKALSHSLCLLILVTVLNLQLAFNIVHGFSFLVSADCKKYLKFLSWNTAVLCFFSASCTTMGIQIWQHHWQSWPTRIQTVHRLTDYCTSSVLDSRRTKVLCIVVIVSTDNGGEYWIITADLFFCIRMLIHGNWNSRIGIRYCQDQFLVTGSLLWCNEWVDACYHTDVISTVSSPTPSPQLHRRPISWSTHPGCRLLAICYIDWPLAADRQF